MLNTNVPMIFKSYDPYPRSASLTQFTTSVDLPVPKHTIKRWEYVFKALEMYSNNIDISFKYVKTTAHIG